MYKSLISTIIIAFSIFGTSAVQAQVSTATLSLNVSPVDFPSVTLLSLRSSIRRDSGNRRCVAKWYAYLSEVGGAPVSNPQEVLLATRVMRKGGSKRSTVAYYGLGKDYINVANTRESQLNVQGSLKCRGQSVIKTNVVSRNVSCDGGLAATRFLNALQNGLQ